MYKTFKDQEVFAYFGDSQYEISQSNDKQQPVIYKAYDQPHLDNLE